MTSTFIATPLLDCQRSALSGFDAPSWQKAHDSVCNFISGLHNGRFKISLGELSVFVENICAPNSTLEFKTPSRASSNSLTFMTQCRQLIPSILIVISAMTDSHSENCEIF
jgi:hypothetical protein